MTEQPLSLTLVLPENSAACEADGSSASMQALEASVMTATALACSGTFSCVKIRVNIRSSCWLTITSTAFFAVFGPDAGGVLTTIVPEPSPFDAADWVAAATIVGLSEPEICSSAPA
ncbi:hypothetical protein [Mesorhizobium sp. M7A.F.Ca.MR.148.00.0.0]|uniref:hypothetical protein n=1 Tax=Mesorhizobium sp. M7A.F.Ca.MR.148.00.0.0 TaxID=2496775 RepID=UPI001FE11370|nr:hypothetical protein [Mesorhizobium sp. M7A.F.Ca.MR.148.00.0.0]